MAGIEGTFSERFSVRAPLDRTREAFADPARVAAHYGKLDRFELREPGTVRFWLPDYSYGITRFAGRYTCQYQVMDPATVRWHTLPEDHNMVSEGTARFSAGPAGSTVMAYQAHLVLDLDVNRILRATIAPFAARAIADEMRAYVQRMIASVEADAAV